jgi:hypothetical protein
MKTRFNKLKFETIKLGTQINLQSKAFYYMGRVFVLEFSKPDKYHEEEALVRNLLAYTRFQPANIRQDDIGHKLIKKAGPCFVITLCLDIVEGDDVGFGNSLSLPASASSPLATIPASNLTIFNR